MATRKHSASDLRSESALPAEPEVTRGAVIPGASNPGREPAHLAAARARRQRASKEETMRREYEMSQQQSPGHRGSVLADGLKVVAGASLGAALMYLLDPEAGEHRREEAKHRAARAAATTGTVLGNVADLAGNVAGNVWDLTTEAGRAMAHRAAEATAAGAATASHFGANLAERAGETAHSVGDSTRRGLTSARRSASGWFGHEEPKRHVPETSTVISAAAALAAGVGMMYLLDPTDGARRRALIGQKANRFCNETGEFFRRTGRHLANRSRGLTHETRSMFQRGGEPADDRTVAERIRARLGHLQRPGADVNVAVMDGRCTITGRCSPDDVEAVLTCVQTTPGVSSVVNLLTVQSPGSTQTSSSVQA